MRRRLEEFLGARFQIVGTAADGQQAIESTLSLNPDILVTDISMPILNGMQVASRLRDLGSSTRVIFVTAHDDDDYREAAFSIGAFGYVLKARIDTHLIPTMEGALQGQRSPSLFPAPQS
jgi:DNA-binding NarL/FixJ family response regulator